MATTAGGTYYAASSELVSSWPATSLDLANQLESRFAAKKALAVKGCSLYNTANLTITAGTLVDITFSAEVFDTDGYHSTSSNTDRITIPTGLGGYYLVTATGNTNGNTMTLSIQNVTTGKIYYGGSLTTANTVAVVMPIAAGEYIRLRAYSAAGTTLYGSTALGDYAPHFSAIYLGT